ncbi:MAG: hypothetical protein ABSF35_20180 [Polyangia bacterium]
MFRLLKLLLVLGLLGAGVFYGMTVKLGERTFFQHLRAIWDTKETQELRRGTKEKVGGLVDEATDHVVKGVAKNVPGKVLMRGDGTGADSEAIPAQPPQEKLSPQDRKALRNIIGQGRLKPSE